MRPVLVTLAPLLLASTVLAGSPSPRDRSWSSKPLGVVVEAPPGWMLSTHSGSPHVAVMLLHPEGARISVSVAPTDARDPRELSDQERRVLEARGFRTVSSGSAARGAAELVVDPPRGTDRVRQLYLVRPVVGGGQAIVLTLTAPGAGFAARSTALDQVLTRLRLNEPVAPDNRAAAPAQATAP